MPNEQKLFAVTQWVLKLAAIGFPILVGFMFVGMAVVPFVAHLIPFEEIQREARVTITPSDFVRLGEVALVGVAAIFTLATLIARRLLRIIESAIIGDPFVEQNAIHLNHIGWLLAGIYATETAMGAAIFWLSSDAIRAHVHTGVVLPFAGLDVLLIFVLARIFRRGTEMRAELEATV